MEHFESSELEVDEVAPDASSMIESMRAYGYATPTAIADLVDNSIAANATTVDIELHWAGEDSWIRIVDDGHGMSKDELTNAMRLGSINPRNTREPEDLGRFGLGLKTASFSQGRRLTVASRTSGGKISVRCWDLDYLARPDVHGWQLLKSVDPSISDKFNVLNTAPAGTVVLIDKLDRLGDDIDVEDGNLHDQFLEVIAAVDAHLSMVFHRYLSRRRKRVRILLNGTELRPWDPFLDDHPATQPTPEELIVLPGHAEPVRVRGYVLPHIDKLGRSDHTAAAGPAGWNAQQGFYLYRNERIIVAGGWLGLGPGRGWTQEEHYKLARIRVEIPNSADHLWQLDVKKSSATPPPLVRARLRQLASTVRKQARSVFAHRGRRGSHNTQDTFQRPWQIAKSTSGKSYRIWRKHPLLLSLREGISDSEWSALNAFLRIVEETVPVEQVWLDVTEKGEYAARPFSGASSSQVRFLVDISCAAIQRNLGVGRTAALRRLLEFEEFTSSEARALIQTELDQCE